MSLRSRIRGGQDYLTDTVATAAQFLTLRLVLTVATKGGCDEPDGPGHAPRYLDVGPTQVQNSNDLWIWYVSSWWIFGSRLRSHGGDGSFRTISESWIAFCLPK